MSIITHLSSSVHGLVGLGQNIRLHTHIVPIMSNKITPELRLKKLRRLEHNIICPNCGTAAPQGLGFGSVCVKFNTFICDLCKTSHQAISHRVKSITMSNWTHDEVNALTVEFGGGNEAALHIWLQNAPGYGQKYRGGSRPKEGDRIDIFKNFVADCYDKGMFRANTPFVPSNSSAAAQSGGESPKPPAAPQPSRTNVLQVPKPAATVDFFNTDPEPSFPATSNTGKDPFACGSAFGDASPVPTAAHSAFSSTTDLLGAGAAAGGGYHNSSSSNHTSPRFPAPPGAQAGLMFDAFNDTPGISPVASFAQFPSSFPPAPASAQRTGSGFDFIEGDPFNSSATASSAGFDSFAPTPTGAASGFDFMTQGSTDPFAANRSGGSSITSSNMNSATNSAFTSNNDLFAFSTAASASNSTNAAAAALSAPSPVPLPPALQVPHDPFGAVFLQPTPSGASSVGSASPYTPPSASAAPQAYQSQNHALQPMASTHSGTGLSAMGAGGTRMGGMGGASGTTGPMMMGSGMSMNAPNGGGGVGYGMNRNVSPVPGMGGMAGGIGYGAGGGGGSAMMGQYPPQGMGMTSQGQQYGMKQQQQQQPPAMLSQQYRTGPPTAPVAAVPFPPRHVDAIGAAFGNLNMGGGQQGYRGPGQQFQSSQLQSQQQPPASSFDFVQTAVKQHLPTK